MNGSKWIKLDGLRMPVRIGIHDFEKHAAQPYRVDIALKVEDSYRVQDNDIKNAVDYDKLYHGIKALASRRHFDLQEELIEELINLSFSVDARITVVRARVRKESVYSDCEGVGLDYEISRCN